MEKNIISYPNGEKVNISDFQQIEKGSSIYNLYSKHNLNITPIAYKIIDKEIYLIIQDEKQNKHYIKMEIDNKDILLINLIKYKLYQFDQINAENTSNEVEFSSLSGNYKVKRMYEHMLSKQQL